MGLGKGLFTKFSIKAFVDKFVFIGKNVLLLIFVFFLPKLTVEMTKKWLIYPSNKNMLFALLYLFLNMFKPFLFRTVQSKSNKKFNIQTQIDIQHKKSISNNT